MVFFDDEDVPISPRLKELGKLTVEAALDFFEFEYETDISIMITDNKEMQGINCEQRGIDKTTDVLSFPMINWPRPCDYDFLEETIDEYIDPDTDCIILGDIVLSMDKLIEQASEYGHSVEREFTFLIVHSMLHLFGYDHMTDKEEETMIHLQKKILDTIDYEK